MLNLLRGRETSAQLTSSKNAAGEENTTVQQNLTALDWARNSNYLLTESEEIESLEKEHLKALLSALEASA